MSDRGGIIRRNNKSWLGGKNGHDETKIDTTQPAERTFTWKVDSLVLSKILSVLDLFSIHMSKTCSLSSFFCPCVFPRDHVSRQRHFSQHSHYSWFAVASRCQVADNKLKYMRAGIAIGELWCFFMTSLASNFVKYYCDRRRRSLSRTGVKENENMHKIDNRSPRRAFCDHRTLCESDFISAWENAR